MNEKKKVSMLVAVILIFIIVIFFAVKCSNQQYSITFDTRGGSKIESQEIKRGDQLEEPEEPKREGYEFLGWYVDDEKFDFSKKITKDVKLVAKWKKIESETTYTVTFDSNGGTDVTSKEVQENEKVSKPTNPTRTGYTFAGWQLDGEDYDFDSQVTKDITLKAVWIKNTSSNTTTNTSKEVVTEPVAPIVPENSDNIGNVSDPNPKPEEPVHPTTPEEPVVVKYTVTFNAMNGTEHTVIEVEEGKTVEKIENPTKKGYIFKTWTLNGVEYNFNTSVTSDITLMATYEKDENVAVVENLKELKEAVQNKVSTIVLANDILDIDETIVLDWMVTLDGNGKELAFQNSVKDGILIEAVGVTIKDTKVTLNDVDSSWNGRYAIQVYNGQASLHNIVATAADGGILVNSSSVTLTGITDVSGNQFGGIEVSKGIDAANYSTLEVKGTLINTTETFGRPTIWIDGDHTNVSVKQTGLTETTEIKAGQTQYYLEKTNTNTVTVTTQEELELALEMAIVETINIANSIADIDQTIKINRAVTINGNQNTLTFLTGVKDGILVLADDTIINDLHIVMTSATGWQGNYGVQVYQAQNVTLHNYTGEGADAALLINGATVYATGTTTVSQNEFGGIEATPGSGVITDSLLYLSGYIVNETEAYGKPTLWVDGPSDSIIEGLIKIEKDGQAQYYILEENTVEPKIES